MTGAQKANSNVAAFGAAILRFSQNFTPAQAALLHRRVTLEALKRIVFKTPVDTGRARGNWQTSIDRPLLEPTLDFSKVPGPVVARGVAATADLKPFAVTYISNNLPYIDALENGHSKQAPQGMVSVTIAELTSGLARAAAPVGAS